MITKENKEKYNMERIVIDISILREYDLSVNNYLNLLYFYSVEKGINEGFVSKFTPSHPVILATSDLVKKQFIFSDGITIQLRERTRELFEGSKDLFLEWFNKFPIKSPSGRVLRPSSDETIAGRKLRKTWNKHFKNNAEGARKAIAVLEVEMDWRRRTNKFEYMQMAQTWLNQGSWEVYEYLLKDHKVTVKREREDYL
jgi:hypothetical protein